MRASTAGRSGLKLMRMVSESLYESIAEVRVNCIAGIIHHKNYETEFYQMLVFQPRIHSFSIFYFRNRIEV